MTHAIATAAVLGLILALPPADAFAARKRVTLQQRACDRSKALVGRFLKLDSKGARLTAAGDFESLVSAPLSPRTRPLFVTIESEVTACTADEETDSTKVRVRYRVTGTIRGPEGKATVSVYFPGKGAHDRVFEVSKDESFRITNADDIYPHVSPEFAASELRKELASCKNDEEKGSLQGAIAEIERL